MTFDEKLAELEKYQRGKKMMFPFSRVLKIMGELIGRYRKQKEALEKIERMLPFAPEEQIIMVIKEALREPACPVGRDGG